MPPTCSGGNRTRRRAAGDRPYADRVHDVEIVRIGPEDWQEFREVRLASLADSPAAFGSRYDAWVDAPEGRWRARLTGVPLTLLARREGRPVGVVSGSPEGDDEVELISMWVAPQLRGTGLARALVDAVVAWAAAQHRTTFLMVRIDNHRARAAYERAGFVDTGVPDDHPADEPPENRMVHQPDA
jgi:RimJ/RimL family protein N-acetyltransferase